MEDPGSAANGSNGAVVPPPPPALRSLVDLSEAIASQPERFATGLVDAGILEQSETALKDVFAHCEWRRGQ